MTQDDIIRMALEAGFAEYEVEDYTPSGYDIRYERFAALVASYEREACAKVCDEWVKDHAKADNCTYADCDFVAAATDCAKAIRARGNT